MNHPNASDWIGLVRGEHSWLVAGRLRRHLKHCPHCAVELKEITSMLAAAKPKEAVASKSLADKTRGALPLSPSQERKLRSLGLVGGVALAAGATLLFAVPGGPLRPTPSFAQVEAAMEKIQTVHWTETMTVKGMWAFGAKGGHVVDADKVSSTRVYDCWAQLEPSRLVRRLVPKETEDLSDERTFIDYEKVWDYRKTKYSLTYMLIPTSLALKVPPHKNNVIDQIVLPTDDLQRTETVNGGSVPLKVIYSPWKQTEESLSGRRALKFTRQVTTLRKSDKRIKTVIVWVTPETMRVVRREEVDSFSHRIAENFHYNATPPAGALELPVPRVGESFRFIDLTLERRNSKANAEAARALIPQVLDAYSKRDTDRFLALWDWDAVGKEDATRLQAQWRKAVQDHTPYNTWRYGALTTGFAGRALYQRKSETEPFPPTYPTTDAVLGAWVTTEKSAYPTLAEAVFSLTKRSGQWKIQNLTLSKDPLPTLWLKGKH
jgi:hypothetical protein